RAWAARGAFLLEIAVPTEKDMRDAGPRRPDAPEPGCGTRRSAHDGAVWRLATREELAGYVTRRLQAAWRWRGSAAMRTATWYSRPRSARRLHAALSAHEQGRGLPSVKLTYVPTADVRPADVARIVGGVVRTLFGTEQTPEKPPPEDKNGAGAPTKRRRPSS